jgi:hypothetical protein
MWFDDEEVSGKRLFWKRHAHRNAALKTRLRASARGAGLPPPRVLLTAAAGVVSAAVLFGFGWRGANALLFSGNSAFNIAHLEVEGGGDLVAYFIRKNGIREGANLFSFDIEAIRNEFLSQRFSARYKSMEIARLLPGTLKVSVVEREPVAQVGQAGGLLVDAEGCVFGAGLLKHGLPVITGCPAGTLRPGDRVQSGVRDAVTVIETCEKAELSRDIMITAIDVRGGFTGKRDDLRLLLDNDVAVDLWWPRRDRQAAESQEALKQRLIFLRAALRRARQDGLRPRRINLALESYRSNCPVTFWN